MLRLLSYLFDLVAAVVLGRVLNRALQQVFGGPQTPRAPTGPARPETRGGEMAWRAPRRQFDPSHPLTRTNSLHWISAGTSRPPLGTSGRASRRAAYWVASRMAWFIRWLASKSCGGSHSCWLRRVRRPSAGSP